MANTGKQRGFEIWLDTGDTIEFFCESIGEAWRIAKQASDKQRNCRFKFPIHINRCVEECHLEPDGSLYETVAYTSGDPIATLYPSGFCEIYRL